MQQQHRARTAWLNLRALITTRVLALPFVVAEREAAVADAARSVLSVDLLDTHGDIVATAPAYIVRSNAISASFIVTSAMEAAISNGLRLRIDGRNVIISRKPLEDDLTSRVGVKLDIIYEFVSSVSVLPFVAPTTRRRKKTPNSPLRPTE